MCRSTTTSAYPSGWDILGKQHKQSAIAQQWCHPKKHPRPLPRNPWHSPKALRSDEGKNPPAWCHRSAAHLVPLEQNDITLQPQRRDIRWTTSGELVPRNNPTCSCVETDPELLNLAIKKTTQVLLIKLAEAQYTQGTSRNPT